MLDKDNAQALIAYAWENLGCDVQIPAKWDDFLEYRGVMKTEYEERRQYRRFYFRTKLVLIVGSELHCVYGMDFSRSGIAFLHKTQLLPKQRYMLGLPNGKFVYVCVERCQRMNERCYLCGTKFARRETDKGDAREKMAIS